MANRDKPKQHQHTHVCSACTKLYVHVEDNCTEEGRICLQCRLKGITTARKVYAVMGKEG